MYSYNDYMPLTAIIVRRLSFLLLCAWLGLAGCAMAMDDAMNTRATAGITVAVTGPADFSPMPADPPRLAEAPAHIALLLPTSGPLAKTAAAVRDGFFAAHFYRLNKTYQPVIQVYDSGTHADTMLAAYRQAVADGAGIVVGPLDRDGVKTLARSGNLAAPTLALNYTDDPGTVPGEFYQFGLSPEDEARAAAERAWLEGRRRAIAFVQKGEWGDRLLHAFKTRFEALGGSVIDSQSYDPASSDFATPLRKLLGVTETTSRPAKPDPAKPEPPKRRQDMDFIFLSAFTQQARQIRPHLLFFYAGDVPVYTTSHIYTGKPDKNADSDMNGLMFSDMPWVLDGDTPQPLQRAITRLWPQPADQFKRLYALGVDAYNLIPMLARMSIDPTERMAGETGTLSMDDTQRIHRELRWARFVEGEPLMLEHVIEPVAPAPEPTEILTLPLPPPP